MASQNHYTIPIAQGQALPSVPFLQLDGGATGINSVTVYNDSPLTVNLFRGQQTAQAGANISVAPYQNVTVPASNVKSIAVGLSGAATVNGTIDLQWTSDSIVALSSPIAQPPSPAQVPFRWYGFDNNPSGGLTYKFSLGKFTLTDGVYVSDMRLWGFDAPQSIEWALGVDEVQSERIFSGGDADSHYVQPLQLCAASEVNPSTFLHVDFTTLGAFAVGTKLTWVIMGYVL